MATFRVARSEPSADGIASTARSALTASVGRIPILSVRWVAGPSGHVASATRRHQVSACGTSIAGLPARAQTSATWLPCARTASGTLPMVTARAAAGGSPPPAR